MPDEGSEPVNIAIIDDLPEELENIRRILSGYAAASRIGLSISAFSSAEELLADYRPLQYGAVFLDIYMEGMSGIDAARRIRETDKDALIVFLTTSEDHMPEAFRLHAYEYIIKPVSKEKLFPVMDDILRRTTPVEAPRFSFVTPQGETAISYDDLVMVGTDAHNYLEVTDSFGETQKTRMTFSAAGELLLQDKRFLLIRRGVIVNMAFILEFDDDLCRLTVGRSVPISIRSRKKLEQTWNNYLMDRMREETMKGARQ